VKHGITFAQSVSHRVIRISELVEGYINSGQKIGFEEQRRIQMDTVDV
jgi:hypothetical protein